MGQQAVVKWWFGESKMLKLTRKPVGNLRLVVISSLFVCGSFVCCSAQTSATITGDRAEVTAGEPFSVHVTFDIASTCDRMAYISLVNSQAAQVISLQGHLKGGSKGADLKIDHIPKDYEGSFSSNNPQYGKPVLAPCDGYSIQKTFVTPTITVNVKPVPDPNTYPTSAGVELSLTEKQFLGTKIADLNRLSSAVDTRVDEDGRDSAESRTFLIAIVDKAQAALTRTENEYRSQLLKPNEPVPAFFADFAKQYADIQTELKAPIPGTSASSSQPAHLIYAQQVLTRRVPSDDRPKSNNRSGTAPMASNRVKSTLEDNASAYRIVQTTGRPTFHAQFESVPSGATLFYRQAIDPEFKTWSKSTNISSTEFTLATFVFKFHRDDCDDEPVRTINPYENIDPDVSVEFTKCRRR